MKPGLISEPLVSIVVPCYRGERYVAEALKSCLAQTFASLEIIVVDDASPDCCGKIAEEFARCDPRVRVLHHAANQGVANAFNTGFAAARGEYFTRLAQDDIFEPAAVAVMVDYLVRHPEIGLVYCDERKIDETGNIIGRLERPEPAVALADGNKIGLCVMWRRSVWETVGGFNPKYNTVEDYEYWLRVVELFPIAKSPGEPQLSMRLHAGMGSRVYSGQQEVLAAKIRAARAPNRRQARRILKMGYFNAAYSYRQQGKLGVALRHLLVAIVAWPFDWKLYRLLAAILLALAGVRCSRSDPS